MKKLILIGMMLFLGNSIASADDGYIINKRAVFIAQMMPRMVGMVTMHGYEIGVSEKTMDIANNIRTKIKPQLKPLMKRMTKLELEIFELSFQKDTHKKISDLIAKIAQIKKKASLIQLECIEMAKDRYSQKDLKLIEKYFKSKKGYMLKYHNVTMGGK